MWLKASPSFSSRHAGVRGFYSYERVPQLCGPSTLTARFGVFLLEGRGILRIS